MPLVENDVRVLRDKAERSSNWSNDPDVREMIKIMTVHEAAAIMLYTQGYVHPVLVSFVLRNKARLQGTM